MRDCDPDSPEQAGFHRPGCSHVPPWPVRDDTTGPVRRVHGGLAALDLATTVAPKMADDFLNWPRELEPYVGKRVRFTRAGETIEAEVIGWNARRSTGARLEVEGHGYVWVGDVEVVE